MYNSKELVGKIVTFITTDGNEYIGRLVSISDDDKIAYTFDQPRKVKISGSAVSLSPYSVTAKAKYVPIHEANIICVLETVDSVASEYETYINDNDDKQTLMG